MKKAGRVNAYLMEILKNHKLAKIFQRENYEHVKRANRMIEDLKDSSRKINEVFIRPSPIMELTYRYYDSSFNLCISRFNSKNELEVSNFFSFLAAMMLAYQPVRSLATLNIAIQQGLEGAKSVLPLIDHVPEVQDKKDSKSLW